LERVGEIKEAAGIYAETKVQELAERKLRFDKRDLAKDGTISGAGNGRRRYRLSTERRALHRNSGRSLTLSITPEKES
jgi:hypothetical protein